MRLGILSDSHGRVQRVQEAVAALEAAGADALVHCGDIGNPEVLEALAGHTCWFVWGNVDTPMPTWRPQVEALGLHWPDGPVEFERDGKKVGVFHGHEREFEQALRAGKYDYLLRGHSHQREDYRSGPTRVINPGALYRAGTPSVAVLDLTTDRLDFLFLGDSAGA